MSDLMDLLVFAAMALMCLTFAVVTGLAAIAYAIGGPWLMAIPAGAVSLLCAAIAANIFYGVWRLLHDV